MTRSCARPGCGDSATATLSYRYATSTVWVTELADEPDPSTYDLCRRHSATLTVPRGWRLEDHRSTVTHLYAADRAS
jgi:hypothetical protein